MGVFKIDKKEKEKIFDKYFNLRGLRIVALKIRRYDLLKFYDQKMSELQNKYFEILDKIIEERESYIILCPGCLNNYEKCEHYLQALKRSGDGVIKCEKFHSLENGEITNITEFRFLLDKIQTENKAIYYFRNSPDGMKILETIEGIAKRIFNVSEFEKEFNCKMIIDLKFYFS